MKKIYILCIFFVLCSTGAFAQVTFKINGNDNIGDVVNGVSQTLDLGYILVLSQDGFLVKTDVNGDTLWTKGYDMNLNGGSSVRQTTDSGYIDAGGRGIIKINRNGDPLWSKNYTGLGYIFFGCQTIDGGYILAGTTDSVGAGGDDIFLIKTDAVGNPTWSKTYGGTSNYELASLQQTSDSGYIIAGGGTYIIKINASGDTLWSKTYSVASNFTGFGAVQQTFEGGYIMAGGTALGTTGGVYLVKTDSIGNVLWSKEYGNGALSLDGSHVQQTTDSGYIISGSIYNISSSNNDVLLMKTDQNGNILWSKGWTFGTAYSVLSEPMRQTSDGGYIMAVGYAYRSLPSEFSLFKTDSTGHSCGGGDYNLTLIAQTPTITTTSVATIITTFSSVATSYTPTTSMTGINWGGCLVNAIEDFSRKQNPITVYPNPVAPNGCISINLNEDLKGAELTIYDIMGEVLYSEVANGTGQTILLQLKGKLSTGMYFLRIKQGENICVQKIVVMG